MYSNKHYMVDISNKLIKIEKLIEEDLYFTINLSRQYGKTTTFSQLYNRLKDKYLVLRISLEGLGDIAFENEFKFCKAFLNLIKVKMEFMNISKGIVVQMNSYNPNSFDELSGCITNFCRDKQIILMIDEVDKSSNNQLFLHFLGVLRNKYLDRNDGFDFSFKSVILAGVYDVKNLKIKIRDEGEKKYTFQYTFLFNLIKILFNSYVLTKKLI